MQILKVLGKDLSILNYFNVYFKHLMFPLMFFALQRLQELGLYPKWKIKIGKVSEEPEMN